MTRFLSIDYLKTGTKRQQEAYKELTVLRLMDKLHKFNPLLAGTIPISIAIDTSDLDIICRCNNHKYFAEELVRLFGKQKFFSIKTKEIAQVTTTIAIFEGQKFKIEIFGQNRDSTKQDAFRHMLIEYRILQEKGVDFRNKIIALKQKGYKTEPAFAKLLGIKGNPYTELLALE